MFGRERCFFGLPHAVAISSYYFTEWIRLYWRPTARLSFFEFFHLLLVVLAFFLRHKFYHREGFCNFNYNGLVVLFSERE